MTLILSLITDEVSPDLADGLAVALEAGVKQVDIRSIGGVNFMSLDPDAQRAAARQIKDAGLTVGTLATPLLKWAAPGQQAGDMGDQFGFDTKGRTPAQLYEDAFRCAEVLDCRDLRVFSYLKFDGFKVGDLDEAYGALLRLAERHDCRVHVENEHVCNLVTVAELVDAMAHFDHPRLRALLDIPNAWRMETRPTPADLAAVTAYVDQIHFKDWSAARGRFVALGDGDIPFAELLAPVYAASRQRDIVCVVETHVPEAPAAATRASLTALKGLISAG